MEKIQLLVLGLSSSPASNNAYALIMKEVDGSRRLPIIIGAFEAQAIALEMEGVTPPRPMTHDLIKNIIEATGATLNEIYINDLKDGTFHAKLIFENTFNELIEVDCRPSDAIAIAVRTNAPIYVNSTILDETGVAPQGDEANLTEDTNEELKFQQNKQKDLTNTKNKSEHLQKLLEKAIQDENYERAAELRDELRKSLENS